MIHKAGSRILSTSIGDNSSLLSPSTDHSSSSSTTIDSSLLSDSQLQLLDYAAQEIKLATNNLVLAVKKELDNNENRTTKDGKLNRSPSKASKRVLPMSPQRRDSLRGSPTKQGRVKRMAAALVDLAAQNNSSS
jgi:hypothetical protein